MTDLRSLLELADIALANHESLDKAIESVEAYSEAFKAWQGSGQILEKESRSGIKRLNDRHERILRRAAELQEAASRNLAEFRKKTRGLKAYLGNPPESRRRRTRRG